MSDYAYKFALIDDTRYTQVMQKRETIQRTLERLDKLVFTSSRLIESCAQELGITPLGQKLSARELLRRPEVRYHQIAQLAQRVETLREIVDTFEDDTEHDDRDPHGA